MITCECFSVNVWAGFELWTVNQLMFILAFMAALFSIFRVSLFWFIRCLCLNICLFWIWCCCKCCHFLFGHWILIHLWFITSSIRMHEVLSIHVFWWPCWFFNEVYEVRKTWLDTWFDDHVSTIHPLRSEMQRESSYYLQQVVTVVQICFVSHLF